jgi:hypothetical protein
MFAAQPCERAANNFSDNAAAPPQPLIIPAYDGMR